MLLIGMWSEKGLAEPGCGWREPIGTTDALDRTGDPSVIAKQWRCGDGYILAQSRPDSQFDLSATCAHRVHHEIVQYPLLKVADGVEL